MKILQFLFPVLLLLLSAATQAQAKTSAELRVRRSADQMADFLIRLETINSSENNETKKQELKKLGEEFLNQSRKVLEKSYLKNRYDFLDSHWSWTLFIPYWMSYGYGFTLVPSWHVGYYGLVGGLIGITAKIIHGLIGEGKNSSAYHFESFKKSSSLLHDIYLDQLRRRGILVKDMDSIAKSIEDLLSGIRLIETPALMAKEIRRMKTVLQSWAEVMNQSGQSAKAEVLIELKNALPSTKNPMRFLRSKAWMNKASESRSNCIEAIKNLAPGLKLESYGIDIGDIIHFSQIASNNQNLKERNLIHAKNDQSWAALAKIGNDPIDPAFQKLIQSLQDTMGTVDFEMKINPMGKLSKASPRILAEAEVSFMFTDGEQFQNTSKPSYRNLALNPLNEHLLRFKFEFSTAEENEFSIVQEGRWLKDFTTTLKTALAQDSVLQTRIAAALDKKVRVQTSQSQCQENLLNQKQQQELKAEEEYQAEAQAEIEAALNPNQKSMTK